jgi:hypothetical protein
MLTTDQPDVSRATAPEIRKASTTARHWPRMRDLGGATTMSRSSIIAPMPLQRAVCSGGAMLGAAPVSFAASEVVASETVASETVARETVAAGKLGEAGGVAAGAERLGGAADAEVCDEEGVNAVGEVWWVAAGKLGAAACAACDEAGMSKVGAAAGGAKGKLMKRSATEAYDEAGGGEIGEAGDVCHTSGTGGIGEVDVVCGAARVGERGEMGEASDEAGVGELGAVEEVCDESGVCFAVVTLQSRTASGRSTRDAETPATTPHSALAVSTRSPAPSSAKGRILLSVAPEPPDVHGEVDINGRLK